MAVLSLHSTQQIYLIIVESHLTLWCVQVLGKVPTISINKTDGCHVYLSKDSLECEIVSAKSSEMNVLVPGKDGDYVSTSMGEFGASSGII